MISSFHLFIFNPHPLYELMVHRFPWFEPNLYAFLPTVFLLDACNWIVVTNPMFCRLLYLKAWVSPV